MRSIPIKEAKRISQECGAQIVVIVAWDRTGMQHVTTYGENKNECGWAADLGNQIKRQILKWPEEECKAKPDRAESSP